MWLLMLTRVVVVVVVVGFVVRLVCVAVYRRRWSSIVIKSAGSIRPVGDRVALAQGGSMKGRLIDCSGTIK